MTDKQSTTSLPLLNYGPAARKRVPRWVIVLTVAVALLLTGDALLYPRVKPHLDQWALLWRQRQLMNWTWPADHVHYSDDPARAAALLESSGYYREASYTAFKGTRPQEHPEQGPWPIRFTDGESLLTVDGRHEVAALFRHGMRTPGGDWRLVTLGTAAYVLSADRRAVMIGHTSFVPATSVVGSVATASSQMGPAVDLATADRFTLFAGQPDGADPNHLVIPYELSGQRGTIDGWLQDDGSVRLQVRSGPARLLTGRWW